VTTQDELEAIPFLQAMTGDEGWEGREGWDGGDGMEGIGGRKGKEAAREFDLRASRAYNMVRF
jgi:hypothetical protein